MSSDYRIHPRLSVTVPSWCSVPKSGSQSRSTTVHVRCSCLLEKQQIEPLVVEETAVEGNVAEADNVRLVTDLGLHSDRCLCGRCRQLRRGEERRTYGHLLRDSIERTRSAIDAFLAVEEEEAEAFGH